MTFVGLTPHQLSGGEGTCWTRGCGRLRCFPTENASCNGHLVWVLSKFESSFPLRAQFVLSRACVDGRRVTASFVETTPAGPQEVTIVKR
jgi:hypothetical protein